MYHSKSKLIFQEQPYKSHLGKLIGICDCGEKVLRKRSMCRNCYNEAVRLKEYKSHTNKALSGFNVSKSIFELYDPNNIISKEVLYVNRVLR